MRSPRTPLPIDDVLPQLLNALRQANCVVLRAPPGAGKTTRVPPALLDAMSADGGLDGKQTRGRILVLQPRRVAARAAAARIASERGTLLGDEIGYQVRFDARTGPRTRIEVITEGILLRRLLDGPFLEGIAAVIFDEFHERSLASDLALGMVRQIQESVRSDLRIVVMSATLAAQPIAAYLGNCPVVESQGRMYPVEVRHLPTLDKRPIDELAAFALEDVLRETSGDVLVFLPGVGEIRRTAQRLERSAADHNLAVMELYGDLPAEKQDAVLAPCPRRKVILATNVAETSLTIEGVSVVVDSGLARIMRFDERTGLDRLEVSSISKASADQRAGRAGRTQAGLCLRLWPEASQRIRPDFEEPEVRRVDLSGALLQLACWIEPDFRQFPWFEAPTETTLQRAWSLLTSLEAVGAGGITPLGRQMAALPVHPRIAKLLLEGARLGVAEQASLVAAMLSEREVFLRDTNRSASYRGATHASRSDVWDRAQTLAALEGGSPTESDSAPLNRHAARQVFKARDQLLRLVARGARAPRSLDENEVEEAVLRTILAAFPDRVARRREPGGKRGVMVGGRGIRLADQVAVGDAELFVCVDVEGGTAEALVRQASAVEREWLPAALLQSVTVIEFDEQREAVTAKKRTTWNTLLLEETAAALPSEAAVAEILAQAATRRLSRVVPTDNPDWQDYLTRVRLLNEWLPNLNLPMLDDNCLAELLLSLRVGCRSFADLRRAPWLHAVKSLFPYQQLQAIDREAPERIAVPSGNQIRLQYEAGRPPILAVRIQEVFGLRETPRIAGGRVPVLMHLLAPNMRVAQITDDLASFWSSTYAMVRKDLRARYPKHSWPEDPYTALAVSRPTRKR